MSLASGICKNFGTRQFINNLELPTQNELDDNTTDDMVKYSITINTIKNNNYIFFLGLYSF